MFDSPPKSKREKASTLNASDKKNKSKAARSVRKTSERDFDKD